MAGRKRKVQDLAVATAAVTHKESDLVLLRTKSERNRRASAKVTSQSVPCESVQRFEPERSHYFNGEPRRRLEQDFYSQPCISLAKAFLGKVLVRRCADGSELRGRIVETEAYLGGEDKASHSAGGKRTERNTAMFMKPGTIYVYPIYGIYLCMNVSSEGEGAAVLLRSLEPLQGQSAMRKLRAARRQEGARQLKDKELCNGPSKLCQALNIPRCFDRRDLASDPEVWLEADESPPKPQDIVSAPRIGIESHGEWAKKPWRFYLRGHPCVSVVNKEAERRSLSVNAADSSDP
ncbi:DNA-3-methyladenine glycosylase-like isoform X1 [Girardinichthys multiradiatus]|uniref:DNA-3-methyladenine glycosylase-like isoform X1 n=1 Tax=Girardinichthys multiradiatus TaxID=208333 RepID=UPI001FABBAC3|nr:DNA-3-methyladenine glycosylase-like isoform X1 [Girardinichthys multiradiatus]